MLDELGLRIRDVVLSEIDLSKELSDEEICDLIGMAVSKEAREIPMTLRQQRAMLQIPGIQVIFNELIWMYWQGARDFWKSADFIRITNINFYNLLLY